MSMAKILRDLREDNDLTQQELADIFHVDRKTILRIEKGHFYPKVDVLMSYSKYFNLSMDYLSGLISTPRTLDGSPYKVSKKITVGIFGGNNDIEIH